MTLKSLAIGLAAAAALTAGGAYAQEAATAADGIYSAEQAARGKEVYDASCSGCHAGNLAGTPGGPGLKGIRFEVRWAEKTVGELYTYIHENMPAGAPGSLTDNQYRDVVAYILEQNQYPASEEAELSTDAEALGAITIGEAP